VRIVGDERLGSSTEMEHLLQQPELAEPHAVRAALTPDLNRAEHFAVAGEAMAVGCHDTIQAVIFEFEEHAVSDCGTNDGVHVASGTIMMTPKADAKPAKKCHATVR
jgi:hypothetical protein